MAIEYQIRKSGSVTQPYYWRIVETSNSSVLATSETYVAKQSAINTATAVRNGSSGARVVDYT